MGYDFDTQSVLNGNYHILTLVTPTESSSNHVLTLSTPVVRDGGGGGTGNYMDLTNKPSINGIVLIGNSSLNALGIQPAGNYPNSPLTDADLEELLRDEI